MRSKFTSGSPKASSKVTGQWLAKAPSLLSKRDASIARSAWWATAVPNSPRISSAMLTGNRAWAAANVVLRGKLGSGRRRPSLLVGEFGVRMCPLRLRSTRPSQSKALSLRPRLKIVGEWRATLGRLARPLKRPAPSRSALACPALSTALIPTGSDKPSPPPSRGWWQLAQAVSCSPPRFLAKNRLFAQLGFGVCNSRQRQYRGIHRGQFPAGNHRLQSLRRIVQRHVTGRQTALGASRGTSWRTPARRGLGHPAARRCCRRPSPQRTRPERQTHRPTVPGRRSSCIPLLSSVSFLAPLGR